MQGARFEKKKKKDFKIGEVVFNIKKKKKNSVTKKIK